jgi:hypothetical protein
MKTVRVVAHTKLQKSYTYVRTEPVGKNFAPEFRPMLTPKEMLELGIFGGNYFAEIPKEFPQTWWKHARLSDDGKAHKELNYFGVLASQSRSVWEEKGWMHPDDPHGWFEWYCRYYMGRRHVDDERQIKRWNAIRRHVAQITNNCSPGDSICRPRQRQALLHWAYDTRSL